MSLMHAMRCSTLRHLESVLLFSALTCSDLLSPVPPFDCTCAFLSARRQAQGPHPSRGWLRATRVAAAAN